MMVLVYYIRYRILGIPLVYRFFIISLFVFVWGEVLVIGTFVLGSLRWYILLGLGFVIRGILFCLLGGIGRCSHCV